MQTVWGYKSSVLDEKRNNDNKQHQFLPKDKLFQKKNQISIKGRDWFGGFFLEGRDDFFPMAWQKFEPGTGSIKPAPKERRKFKLEH